MNPKLSAIWFVLYNLETYKVYRYQNFVQGIFLTLKVNAGIYNTNVYPSVRSSVQHLSQEWAIILNFNFFQDVR